MLLPATPGVHDVGLRAGFFITSGGYEFNLVLGIAALSIAFTGPGALSLDSVAGFASAGAAWGLGAAVVGGLGAVGQLAQRHQSPGAASGAVEAASASGSHAS